MSNRQSVYQLSYDQMRAVKTLALLVKNSKQQVGTQMKDAAEVVHRFTEKTNELPVNQPGLEPGEVCLLCHSVGQGKKQPKGKPTCPHCTKPFTRGKPWRLLRGRRVHVSCIK